MNESASQTIIDIEHVSFAYNGLPVLSDVSLRVQKGEFLVVLGPNGGGKSTLLKLVLGLLKPASGRIRVFGEKPGRQAGRIGYVPQHFELNPGFPITVLETTLLGLQQRGISGFRFSSADRQRAAYALEQTGTASLAKRRMDQLSGGQRQRVMIARALVTEPELLLFDEPTANIDPYGRYCFYEVLEALQGDITTVAVSHDISVATSEPTSIACVNRELIHNPEPNMTREMLCLLYGLHGEACPMDTYLNDMEGFLDMVHQHHQGHHHHHDHD